MDGNGSALNSQSEGHIRGNARDNTRRISRTIEHVDLFGGKGSHSGCSSWVGYFSVKDL